MQLPAWLLLLMPFLVKANIYRPPRYWQKCVLATTLRKCGSWRVPFHEVRLRLWRALYESRKRCDALPLSDFGLVRHYTIIVVVKFAKNRLNKFYNKDLYKAPPKRELSAEDRVVVNMGGTLAPTAAPGGIAGTGIAVLAQVGQHSQRRDAQPEAPSAYAKKSEESGGVIAMIDLLIKDLDKELTESQTAEKSAQSDYEKLTRDSAEKRATDSNALTDQISTKAALEAELEAQKEAKMFSTKELMATLEYIQSLHAECDWLVQNFDVRKEARSGEVEALDRARDVLNGADYSFVQRDTRTLLARPQ